MTSVTSSRVLDADEEVLHQPAGVASPAGRLWTAAVSAVRRHQYRHVRAFIPWNAGGKDTNFVLC